MHVTSPRDGVTFAEMANQAPDLATMAEERFGVTGLSLVATLRRDGWPRISPVEPRVFEGQLYLGMMPRSMKSLDLERDDRCLVHSTVSDKDGRRPPQLREVLPGLTPGPAGLRRRGSRGRGSRRGPGPGA